ncbi:MAG TPA: right-handed parallel beta-helix repeat-containing protein [Armatimonadota bacterium]|nr:right-handed parallel beta-helix repeat-containing protein [Armatimonadota bacterium]
MEHQHAPAAITHAFDVTRFGAKGDGATDDTAAIQRAIDAAGEVSGAVWFPAGLYQTSRLRMRSTVSLVAHPSWSYHRVGNAVLRLCDPQAPCLLDLTGSIGARVSGMSLDGGTLGEHIAGIYLDGLGHKEEETLCIENTRVAHFTGDAITMLNVWAYTVRHCMLIFNGGNGITITRWDGFLYHNIINNCRGYGLAMLSPNGASSIIGHRIEWNDKGGIYIEYGGHYHINDCYFDYNGGPALHIHGTPARRAGTFAVTGNLFNRNGAKADPDSLRSAHCLYEYVDGLVMTGNTLRAGVNDGGGGPLTPGHGIVCEGLRSSILRDNVLHAGATRELVVDRGGHDAQTIIRDNIGTLAEVP